MINTKKKWYMSKTVIVSLIALIMAILSANGVAIPNEVYVILGSLGIVGLRTATTNLKK